MLVRLVIVTGASAPVTIVRRSDQALWPPSTAMLAPVM